MFDLDVVPGYRSPVRSAVLLVAVASCGPPKLAYWTLSGDQVAWAPPSRPRLASDGHCRATLHVHVVDDAGAAVAGAEVILRRGEHIAAPSTVHTDVVYQTAIVHTNKLGDAITCTADSVPETKNLLGDSRGGFLLARLGDKTGSIPVGYADTPTIILHR